MRWSFQPRLSCDFILWLWNCRGLLKTPLGYSQLSLWANEVRTSALLRLADININRNTEHKLARKQAPVICLLHITDGARLWCYVWLPGCIATCKRKSARPLCYFAVHQVTLEHANLYSPAGGKHSYPSNEAAPHLSVYWCNFCPSDKC